MMPLRSIIKSIALLVLFITSAYAHARFVCPPPRSSDAGIKNGPCGAQTNMLNIGPKTTIAPGPFTIYWEETISHGGSPFRISLSINDDSKYEQYVLLDHIPHNDGMENSYAVTVNIPDIDCENCGLQLINFMTDKLRFKDGDWSDTSQCDYDPQCHHFGCPEPICFSLYHSCSNIKIAGSQPTSEYMYSYNPPQGWPFALGNPYLVGESSQYDGIWVQGFNGPEVGFCAPPGTFTMQK